MERRPGQIFSAIWKPARRGRTTRSSHLPWGGTSPPRGFGRGFPVLLCEHRRRHRYVKSRTLRPSLHASTSQSNRVLSVSASPTTSPLHLSLIPMVCHCRLLLRRLFLWLPLAWTCCARAVLAARSPATARCTSASTPWASRPSSSYSTSASTPTSLDSCRALLDARRLLAAAGGHASPNVMLNGYVKLDRLSFAIVPWSCSIECLQEPRPKRCGLVVVGTRSCPCIEAGDSVPDAELWTCFLFFF